MKLNTPVLAPIEISDPDIVKVNESPSASVAVTVPIAL